MFTTGRKYVVVIQDIMPFRDDDLSKNLEYGDRGKVRNPYK